MGKMLICLGLIWTATAECCVGEENAADRQHDISQSTNTFSYAGDVDSKLLHEAVLRGKENERFSRITMERQIDQFVFPSFDFDRASLDDVLHFIRNECENYASRGGYIGTGLRFAKTNEIPLVTIHATNCTLRQIIEMINKIANTTTNIEKGAILVFTPLNRCASTDEVSNGYASATNNVKGSVGIH